ncbi:MliC family protein [Pannonibacter sp. SL95]|uniref:MliC family protein n=1 Tax=Pannonibacter sp. SL95 TaxID=2995153 RepID=UPI0022754AA8|nr:MliC family protein [Pannonibacter sp. SL95]MCY1706819.1 MliC family protein [Pannonibacter sp. SL95]
MRLNGYCATTNLDSQTFLARGRLAPAKAGLTAVLAVILCSTGTAIAQTPPKEMRVQVVPAEPGIRSILVNKRYRPIISRGIEGAVVETVTGNVDPGTVGCQVDLEITLENSRVLRRAADICGSGGTVVVDVNKDPGLGRPRVVGTDAAPVAPSQPAAASTTRQPAEPATQPAQSKAPAEAGSAAVTVQQPAQAPAQQSAQPTAPAAPAQAQSQVQSQAQAPGQVPSVVTEALTRQPDAQQPSVGALPATIPGAAPIVPIAPVERIWSTTGTQLGSKTAGLLHASAQGTDRDFEASCTPQSGFATLRVARVSPRITPGSTVPVAIRAEEFYATYDAVGTTPGNGAGSWPEFTVSLTDPLWDAMARKSQLEVIIDGQTEAISLKGSAQPVRLFTATCAEPQKIVEESQDPALAGAGELSCAEYGSVRSLDGGFRGRMVFRNARSEPVDVSWIDYSGGQRFYARLLPGQVLDQESILSNAWLVTNAGGQCLGLYVSRAPRQDVVIGNRASGGANTSATLPAPLPTGPLPPAPVGGVDPVNYLCTAGIDLQVLFDGTRDVAVVTEFGQISVTLPRVPSGSGFRYESNGYSFAGQRDNATWSRPGLYDAFCGRN